MPTGVVIKAAPVFYIGVFIVNFTLIFRRFFFLIAVFFTSALYASSKPIIIGLDADMSAVAAEGGVAIKRGAELAIAEVNQSGGVLGRPLQLEVRDHRGNPARGLANIEYFAQQSDVVAVLGGVHTPVALHELPAIHQHQMIYLGPWAAGTPIVDNGYQPNYVFRLSVRDADAGPVLMNYINRQSYKKAGLLLERTGWGRSNEKSMRAAAESLGIEVVGVEWFNWREKSMLDQLERLSAAGVEVILLVANAPEGAAIVKEMAAWDQDKRLPIVSHWGIAGGAFVKMAGRHSIEKVDVSVLQTYSFLAPNNQQYMEKLLSGYQQAFDHAATAENIPAAVGVVHAYDLVHLLANAITAANSVDRSLVRNALELSNPYSGVLKHFDQPFTPERHDALSQEDYIITKYNDRGYLVPVKF